MSAHGILPECCRCCLAEENDMIYVFDILDEFDSKICDLIANCGGILITDDDNYSKNICGDCLNDLANAARFRMRCLKTENILQNASQFQKVIEVGQSLVQNNSIVKEVDVEEIKIETEDSALEPLIECHSTLNEHIEVVVAEDPNDPKLQGFDYDNLISSQNSEQEEDAETLCSEAYVTDELDTYFENIEATKLARAHTSQLNFVCPECGAGFAMQKNLSKHLISHGKFACNLCLALFENIKDLRTHELKHATAHGTLNSPLDQKDHKQRSAKIESKKLHICAYCNKAFVSNSALAAHVRVHTLERPFPCHFCEKKFRTVGAQELHERRHSGIKPYQCDICGRGFAESSNLKVHRRIHTKEKPHVCIICNRAFARVFLLKIHQRTHTGERPFPCTDCGKSFSQQGDLSAHRRIHTGERPFKCNICGKGFIKNGGLKQHMKQHVELMQQIPVADVLHGLFFLDLVHGIQNCRSFYSKIMWNQCVEPIRGVNELRVTTSVDDQIANFLQNVINMNCSYIPQNDHPLEVQHPAAEISVDSLDSHLPEETEPTPATSRTSTTSTSDTPTIVYLDKICRTCLEEKEKDQLKDLFEFALAETVMECANITIEEADGLPCHICVKCLEEVERICSFRQQCERSDVSIRSLIEKSVIIRQDCETKYEVLNVILTDAEGNTETSAVVVPVEELRFQLMNGSSTVTETVPDSMSIPIVGINKTVQFEALEEVEETGQIEVSTSDTNFRLNFPVPVDLLETEDNVETQLSYVPSIIMNPSELLNEPEAPQICQPDELSQQEESTVLENLKKELSEFIGNIPKEQELDDNDDDEMIHVDYLKDALTEEYIQSMEKQLASSVTRSDDSVQHRLEQEHMASLINDEDRLLAGDRSQQQGLTGNESIERQLSADSSPGTSKGNVRHCKICDIDFESTRHYHNHMKKHSEKRFECPHCSRKFSEKFVLKNHILRHTGEKTHVCDQCDARFYQKNMLNIHKRRHSNERRYNCETCGKRFKSKSLLNTHNKIHLGEKSHKCLVCSKGFTLSWQLKAHSRIHTNEKPFECPYCQKRFNQNGNLMIHIRIHTGEKPFQCEICAKAYPSQGELSGHMRQHTGEKKVKNIVCTVCEKAFAGKGDLKIHMRTHTKEKPYTCQMCGKSFMLHVHLTVHMRSHTGEKPFSCTVCQKAFATNYQLKNHTYVHTGEKNYPCDLCDRRFSSSANRNTHRKTHDSKIS
ncbi:uncharacterized protein LOC131428722 [Malaya genurostris]|uniref:uncharacterized protein LOC131428722 n=1 Tax=Malaya genurostris TaxID=325434 RepID=UPI0026F3E64D|nr:uncharacterized protein LOC131428722 [Malaya genurostris]